jgi:pyruvate carboxylase subunit B
MGNVRYENLSNESKNLLLGKYGDLPGEVNIDLYNKAKETSTDLETGQEVEDEMNYMKAELKKLCLENNLDDLSENLEMLLTYVLFPNIALKFFKSLN